MKFRICLLAFLSCVYSEIFSQTQDEKYLYSRLNLANSIKQKNQDSALKILIAVKPGVLKSDSLSGLYYRIYAAIKSNDLQKDSALFYLDKSILKFKQANNQKQQTLSILNSGNIHSAKGNNELALKSYYKALKMAEANNFLNETAMICKNIGVVFINENKIDQALNYYNRSLDLYTKTKDTSGISSVYINIGNAYYNSYDNQGALKFYNKALDLETLKGDSNNIAKLKHNIGVVYIDDVRDTVKGVSYLLEALKIKENNRFISDLNFEYNELATIFCHLKQYSKTQFYLDKSMAMALKSNNKYELAEVYRIYAMMYSAKEDFKQAYLNYKLYHGTRDSILNIEKLTITDEMEARYNLSKKDLEIANNQLKISEQEKISERKNNIIAGICVFALALVVGIIIYFRNRKAKIQKLNEEKATLLMLESEQKERIRIARELHDSVGQKLTVLKMYSSETNGADLRYQTMLDDTIQEVRNLSHNMIPEILNLGLLPALKDLAGKINISNTVRCELKGDEEILRDVFDKETELSLYRIIQEVLNNMLKHSKASMILVSFARLENKIRISIEDNGVGFNTNSIQNSKGMGWHNIFTRAKLVHAMIDVKSSAKGTSVQLVLENNSWKK